MLRGRRGRLEAWSEVFVRHPSRRPQGRVSDEAVFANDLRKRLMPVMARRGSGVDVVGALIDSRFEVPWSVASP